MINFTCNGSLNYVDALHNWRQLQKDKVNFSQVLLDKCGLWGCILGGVITSNVAQLVFQKKTWVGKKDFHEKLPIILIFRRYSLV